LARITLVLKDMKSIQVIRTGVSPYQARDFISQEREMVSSIYSLEYRELDKYTHCPSILITNTHTQLSSLPPGLLSQTKLIIHPNSGYDNFGRELEKWLHIPTIIGHKIRAQAVAEYSLSALFQGLSELPQHIKWDSKRKWNRNLIGEKNVWIFGYGHIGKILSDTLAKLGTRVTVVDPYVNDCPHAHINKWSDAHLIEADVIISTMSLNKSSELLFNQDFFSKANPNLLFINGARGQLVEEKSLKEFLLLNPEAMAFLDVFQHEPFEEEWIGFPQVWKTSHIAGVENKLDQKILNFEKEVLEDYINLNETNFHSKYEKEILQNKWIKGILV
jgi:phosphoglycerate dehydrogenase-like enzyme